jgi:hypothetical protein
MNHPCDYRVRFRHHHRNWGVEIRWVGSSGDVELAATGREVDIDPVISRESGVGDSAYISECEIVNRVSGKIGTDPFVYLSH